MNVGLKATSALPLLREKLLAVRPEGKSDASVVSAGKTHVHVACDTHGHGTNRDQIQTLGRYLLLHFTYWSVCQSYVSLRDSRLMAVAEK